MAVTAVLGPRRLSLNISVAEAARRLGISASYIYKNKRTLPFVIGIGRRVVCSTAKVEQWNERRALAGKTP